MSRSIPGNPLNLAAIVLLLSSTACGQANAPLAAVPADETSATFEIPTDLDDFEKLIAFVEEIDNQEPAGDSQQEQQTHYRKIARTIVAATGKLSTDELSDEQAMQCVYFKLQGLQILKRLGEPNIGEQLSKAVDAALADKRADVQSVGAKFMVESGFSQWATWGEEEKAALIEKITNHISSQPPQASQIDMVMAVVDFLGDMRGEKLATKLMTDLLPHFKKGDDPQIKQNLVMLEGINRRMQLPGNPIQLKGTLLDGSELDWKSYRGKVVLVDFWATWCGPCRAEVPNILKMYQAYHDKGFEVLGISLDNTPEDAESYISQTSIPWPTMYSDKQAERGWRHPMAVRYGITGIPRAILVDREGKVVHMTARGPNLERELRRLLGEPVAHSRPNIDRSIQPVNYSTPK